MTLHLQLGFEGPDHAFRGGLLIGLLMKHGIDVTPEVDENGNYLNRIKILDDTTLAPEVELVLEIALLPRMNE